MTPASQAAAQLPRVKQLAEQDGDALKQAFALIRSGALVGPAATRLQRTLSGAHQDARSGFYGAYDAVHRLASEDGPPPRIGEPFIPGPPRGGPSGSSGERSGSPDRLDQLGREVSRAARSWRDAGAALARIFGGLGLSTAPAQAVSRAADRVQAQRPDIERRRDELLKTDQQQVVDAAVRTIQGFLPRSARVNAALGDLWHAYAHRYLPGVGEGVKDIGLSGLATNPFTAPLYFGINRRSWMERGPVGQVTGLVQGVQHPGAFAKAVVNWDEWKRDPIRAFGETVPTIVLIAVGAGTGSASGVSTRLGNALRKGKPEKPGPAVPPDLKVAGPKGGSDANENNRAEGDGNTSSDGGNASSASSLERQAANIGQEIKKLPRGSGKPDRLAEALTGLRLSHADAVRAAIKASEEAFGEVGGTAPAVGGGTVILPKILSQKIVLIVKPDGSVVAARGDIMGFIAR